jgi:hypothetical protein
MTRATFGGKISLFKTFVVAVIVSGCVGAVAIGATPVASAQGKYSNCTQAHQDGRYDIPKSDPDYWSGGDRDHDGVACES